MHEDELVEKVTWTDNARETICSVEHWFGDECVRRASHILKHEGNSVLGSIGAL